MIVNDFFEALQAGKELKNAETWKNGQLLASKLVAIAGFAVGAAALLGYPLPITQDQLLLLCSAAGVISGLFNGSATLVSTTRIGLPPRGDAVPPGTSDGSGDGSPGRPDGQGAGPDDHLPDMSDRG